MAAQIPKAPADVTVITAAYSMSRWDMTCLAIESALRQTLTPREIIVPVDHNRQLYERLDERWAGIGGGDGHPSIRIVESRYDGHLGASATTAAELAGGEYLAFLDDDAVAEPDWLRHLLAPFQDPTVIAVGGAPIPVYSVPRPRWFPYEFDWVFGCTYVGLPTSAAPILHLIGTTMAVRRKDLMAIGGIHSNDHGDMEMSHRLLEYAPGSKLIYEPNAVVRHLVHEDRLTWSYFWRRCFFVNRSKVHAIRDMGAAGHLRAERRFAQRALTHGVLTGLGQFARGDVGGLLRAIVICVGLGLAGVGYLTGTLEWRVGQVTRKAPPPGLRRTATASDGGPEPESAIRRGTETHTER